MLRAERINDELVIEIEGVPESRERFPWCPVVIDLADDINASSTIARAAVSRDDPPRLILVDKVETPASTRRAMALLGTLALASIGGVGGEALASPFDPPAPKSRELTDADRRQLAKAEEKRARKRAKWRKG